jgi:hypothetical protein
MTMDIWFCRVLGIGTVLFATFSERSEMERQTGFVMGLVLICTAMILRNMRDRP